MTKRFLAMTMAGILCAGALTGCGSSGADSSADGAVAAADDAYNISVVVKLTDGHFNKVMAGAQAYADEHDNVNIEILSPTSATAYDEQMNMIETALSNDSIDALVVSPQQSATAATLMEQAGDKAIIALDTDFISEKKSAFVGTGNEDAAKRGGQAAVEMAKANGVEAPTVVILTGTQGDETHDARLNGYTAGAEAAGGEIIEVQYCDALADRAATATESILQKYPDGIDILLSTNDDMAMGAVKVLSDWNLPAYADTVICGFDGNLAALQAVQDGTLAIDIVQQGYDMGYKAIEAAVKVLEGETVAPFIDSGVEIVNADNVDACIEDLKSKGLWGE